MVNTNPVNDDRVFLDTTISPVCSRCIHLIDVVNKSCMAYPKGNIPEKIWNGKNNHTAHVKGDNGILFKKMTLEEAEAQIKENQI